MKRNTQILLFIVVLSILFVSCSRNSTGPNNQVYKKIWDSLHTESYTIEQTINCFCYNAGRPVELTIFNDSIISAVYSDTQEEVENNNWHKTVDELFEWIEKLQKSKPETLEIDYHPQYGFPIHIYVDHDKRIADEEIAVETKLINFLR